jgi:hypothetical protein
MNESTRLSRADVWGRASHWTQWTEGLPQFDCGERLADRPQASHAGPPPYRELSGARAAATDPRVA